jgi:hypothetical protein
MQIELFIERLEKLSSTKPNFKFQLGQKIKKEDIEILEKRIGVVFPEKLTLFYLHLNGLKTENLSFIIIPINELQLVNENIHFATFNNIIPICLNTKTLNQTNEWSIINKATNYELTKSISSFWSNKIWHWLEKGNTIWEDNWWKS